MAAVAIAANAAVASNAAVAQIELPTPAPARLAINACPGEPDVEFVRDSAASLSAIRGLETAAARVREEIEFRAVQFGAILASTPPTLQPDYRLVDRETKRWGECSACGIELPEYIGGMCNLCGAAWRKALRAAGRIT